MAKVYEHITASDHVRFAPFTHAAFEKVDLVTIGAMHGIADISSASGDAVEIDCGTPRVIFRAAADVAGSPAVGGAIYVNAGALTMTAGGSVYGVITGFDSAVVEFAVVGCNHESVHERTGHRPEQGQGVLGEDFLQRCGVQP